MRHVTLRQLRVFECVARHRSVTRAAEELHLTQPTVSIQIKQLTEMAGLPLTEVVGKKLYLTDAGAELQRTCEAISDQLAQFDMLISDMKGSKTGRLRISVISTAQYFIPRLLGKFNELYPGIEVQLQVDNRGKILERLTNNADDLYVLGQPPDNIDLHSQAFLDNPLVVIAPQGHALAEQHDIPLKTLAKEHFIIREAGSGTRLATEKLFQDSKLPLRIRMELGSNEAIKVAVAGGLGLAVISAHALSLERNSDEILVLDVCGFPIRRQWYVLTLPNKRLSVVAQTFLDFMLSESKTLATNLAHPMPLQTSQV